MYVNLLQVDLGNDTTVCRGNSMIIAAKTPGNLNLPGNLRNGLLGYWPFNGNANDVSGNGNHLSFSGNPTINFDKSNRFSGYFLDGDDNFFTTSNFFNTTNDHSVSIWFKLYDSTRNTNTIYNTSPHRNVSIGYNTYFLNQTKGFSYCLGNSSTNTWYNCGSTSSFYPDFEASQWNNITVIRNGAFWHFYINGKLQHLFNSNQNYLNQGINLMFGSISCCSGEFYKGWLDDISVFNRALSPSEIQQLFNHGQSSTLWSTGDTTPTINVTPTQTTTYYCTV
ncbi:MAG: LamG domain-containing protein, partial [Bacteroidia bacterium]